MSAANRWMAITAMAVILICALVTAYRHCTDKEEPYFYNTYNRDQVSEILKERPSRMTLDQYVNILDSTENLKTISLQALCNRMILGCDSGVDLNNPHEFCKWAKAIAGEQIIKCVLHEDWYRLTLILLKLFDSRAAVDPECRDQWFERTPTNGVFGVESIRMMKDGEIYPMWKLPKIAAPPLEFSKSCDELYRLYQVYVYEPFANELNIKLKSKTKCDLLSIPLFCMVGCVMALPIFSA